MKRAILLLALIALTAIALADETIPILRKSAPDRVVITLHVGSDKALVRETCDVYLPAGPGEVRFQWTDAAVDTSSLVLYGPQDVAIGSVRQPAGTSNTYAWPVNAQQAGGRKFTASYFLKGIAWTPTYQLVLDQATQRAALTGQLHITNDSKLPLRDVRMQLSVAPASMLEQLEDAETGTPPGTYAVLERCVLEPGWQKRFTFVTAPGLPARIVYRAEPEARGETMSKYVMLDLSSVAVPGTLPKGHMEIREERDGVMVPVVATDLVHAADKVTEIRLGDEPDIIYDRSTLRRGKDQLEFDRIGRVSGYDTWEEIANVFRNRTRSVAHIELIEKIPGKWDMATKTAPALKEANEVRWEMDVEPDARAEMAFTVTRHTGTRAD